MNKGRVTPIDPDQVIVPACGIPQEDEGRLTMLHQVKSAPAINTGTVVKGAALREQAAQDKGETGENGGRVEVDDRLGAVILSTERSL